MTAIPHPGTRRPRRATAALPALLALLVLPLPALAAETFDARAFRVEDLIGEVDVRVESGTGRIGVSVTGPEDLVKRTSVVLRDGEVVVDQDLEGLGRRERDEDQISVRVSVPAGSAVTIGNLIGEARIGDLDGPLTLALASAAEVKAGRVSRADLRLSGAGAVTLGTVAGPFDLSISGAGDVRTGSVGGPVKVGISGTGNVEIASVAAPVSIGMSGMASVAVRGGHTPRLEATISGMGSLDFDGVADSRSIRNTGIASVNVRGDGKDGDR